MALLFSLELPAKILNGFFVILESIVTVPNMKNRILIYFQSLYSFLQTFSQLLLLFFEDLQGRKEISFIVELQASGDGTFVAVIHPCQQRGAAIAIEEADIRQAFHIECDIVLKKKADLGGPGG